MKKEFEQLEDDHFTRENVLKCCRYYRGEDDCPFDEQPQRLFWGYERLWFNSMFGGNETDGTFGRTMLEYEVSGLSEFEPDDIAPKSLKALIFNRYSHWLQGSADDFRTWYISVYCGD